MARKLRLEYAGAIYHVINRGNYRGWLFKEDGAKASFEATLFDACERYGWVLHAYVVMGNHYHLALETSQANLVAGMQWLQGTFANRFNRLRKERGHLFQGRFKALIVEPGAALGQLCHYIHLNPVRARIVPVERLRQQRYCSMWFLGRVESRPQFLRMQTALTEAGGLVDTAAGHRSYLQYLEWQAKHGPAGKNKAYEAMSRGWALGSGAFKRELLKEYALEASTRTWDATGAVEIREARWETAVQAAIGKLPAKVRIDARKSAPWKVAVASHLKATTDVANGWLARRLEMGSAAYVSKHVGLSQDAAPDSDVFRLLRRMKGKR